MYAKCGEINEAFNIFRKLPVRDLISWTSMITAYGSNGQAREALKLFDKMESANVKPDAVTFLAVLSACSHAGLVDEATYVSLSNMYASSSKWKDMRTMRLKMKELSMRKSPGCSWIDIDNRVTMFFAEDTVHRDSEMVRECLGHLYCHMERDEKLEYSETEMSAWVASS
ncbi:Pentatricopeptide repeat-containing protein At5g27110 [Linum perenne]